MDKEKLKGFLSDSVDRVSETLDKTKKVVGKMSDQYAENKERQQVDTSNQNNKVVNVTLKGGIIGMLADSPQNALNRRIKKENANGWKVIQIIPASSGNILLIIFRVLLLFLTLFLFTTANGYYIIMVKE